MERSSQNNKNNPDPRQEDTKAAESIGLWGTGNKETKLTVIQDIGKLAGVKTLSITTLKLSYLKRIRRMASKGFEQKLVLGKNKTECFNELVKVFPKLDKNTSLAGMRDLIEVVNKCQH